VSGRNLDALLKSQTPTLLFPGGVREVYHKKGEDYQIFWPEKGEFVRTAAKHNSTIVPFAAVGVADSVEMVADSTEILNLPFLGDFVRSRTDLLPKAREQETFVAPVSVPRLPSRFYFLFLKPVQTNDLDYKDKKACQDAYDKIKADVEDGIAKLLKDRENDPFKDFGARVFYEAVNNRTAPQPTLS